jgi:hypothetical protein
VLCTPHMNSCLCVNWTLVSGVCFLWKVKSTPSAAARVRRAPCLVVCARGVWVCLVLYVCESVLRLVNLWGIDSPRAWGVSVYGKVHVPIYTSNPPVRVVWGGWPSTTLFARAFVSSRPSGSLMLSVDEFKESRKKSSTRFVGRY